MGKSAKSLLRFQFVLFTGIGILLGIGFSWQNLSARWEQEYNYRAAIVKTTITSFRTDLLRGEYRDLQVTLQNIAQVVGTKDFHLLLPNGSSLDVRPAFTAESELDSKKCVLHNSDFVWESLTSSCVLEETALYYDTHEQHPLLRVRWEVEQPYWKILVVSLLRSLTLFIFIAAVIAYLTRRLFERQLINPLNLLTKQLGEAADKIALGQPVDIKECSGSAVTEIRLLNETSRAHIAQIVSLQKSLSDARVYEAIARTTTMLAHDIRKPFSMLRISLGMLGRATDPAGVKAVLGRVVSEVDRSMNHVNGMLADLLEVGSSSTQLIQEPAAPEALIESTLQDIFRVYPKSDIAIKYDLNHKSKVNVHVQKVARVFSNIYGNAVQAIHYTGQTWFKTSEQDGFVEFCLGNAGSYIPPESLARLFEAFFTSGKKGGTGLGLAIAEKVVKAHDGKIWCVSDKSAQYPDGFVEFHFTLPIAEGQASAFKGILPKHSADITKALLAVTEAPEAGASNSSTKEETDLEAEVVTANKKLGRTLQILLVDDEEIYRSGLLSALSRSPELTAALTIIQASTSDDALGIAAKTDLDLVITDIDLGAESRLDGFDLVATLRSEFNKKHRQDSVISVHTNRIVPADQKMAISKGADAFITKPVSRVQLLKLLLQSYKSITPKEEAAKLASKTEAKKIKPQVAVLEDNIFMLEAWVETLKEDSEVFSFASPEDFIAHLERDPSFLARLSVVISDLHFDNSTKYDGVDVGKIVKSKRPALAILLCSDGGGKGVDLAGAIDHVIEKDPATLGALTKKYGLKAL